MYHSELAATVATGGHYRVGVGLSRIAEALLAGIAQLREPVYKRLLVEKQLTAALEEADALVPALEILNAGKGSQASDTNQAIGFGKFRKIAGGGNSSTAPKPEQSRKAASDLYGWLKKEASPLRAVLNLLGGHGAFFAAMVSERTARAWAEHKPATAEDAMDAAAARSGGCSTSRPSARREDDACGLVE